MKPLTQEACQKKLNGIHDALYAIGGKWKLKILIALKEGSYRFNEIQRTVDISAKMLSHELKELELNGFITRKINPGPPVVVEYIPTEYSHTLWPIMTALSEWGEMHREKIRNERQ